MLAAIDSDHLTGHGLRFKEITRRGYDIFRRGTPAKNSGRLLTLEVSFALAIVS